MLKSEVMMTREVAMVKIIWVSSCYQHFLMSGPRDIQFGDGFNGAKARVQHHVLGSVVDPVGEAEEQACCLAVIRKLGHDLEQSVVTATIFISKRTPISLQYIVWCSFPFFWMRLMRWETTHPGYMNLFVHWDMDSQFTVSMKEWRETSCHGVRR